MRVLLVHNYYLGWTGESAVFERETKLLEETEGVTVRTFTASNESIGERSLLGRLSVPVENAWSFSESRRIRDEVRRFRPDIVHAHNIWPLLSPAIFRVLREEGIPTVFTSHHYQLFCANGLFFRDGRVCTDCFGHSQWRGVINQCYRGVGGSLTRSAGHFLHERLQTFQKIDLIMTPTMFLRDWFTRAGFSPERVVAKPLSVDDPWQGGARGPAPLPDTAVFLLACRLVVSKGGEQLLRAVAASRGRWKVLIAGNGPEEAKLHALIAELGIGERVEMLGHVAPQRLHELIGEVTAVVVPSIWFETFGLTTIEAYSHARTIVVSDIGALREVVIPDETGLQVPPGDVDSLSSALDTLADDRGLCQRLGTAARRFYEQNYTPERNRERLLAAYESLLESRRYQPA